MLYLAYQNSKFKRQIEYTFNLIISIYGIPHRVIPYGELAKIQIDPLSVVISYGKERPKGKFTHQVHIYESSLFDFNYLKPESMPKTPLPRFRDLPIIYSGNGNLPDWVVIQEIEGERKIIETNIDIIASSFFMLTRYEEVVTSVQDKYERFPAVASLAYQEGFLDRPIVNEYIDLLWSWIDEFNLGLKRKKLWNGKDFAVCLTHDVDVLRKYNWYPPLRAMASWTFKHGKPSKALAMMTDYLNAKINGDPYNKFAYLMKLSRAHGLRSTFYFMSGGKTDYDNRYEVTERVVISLMKNLQENGAEIGLHTSFNAFDNAAMITAERQQLEKALGGRVHGVRQHYLRWKTPDSWVAQEEAGLKYDATLAFADHEGFRCGICTPFKPFDIIANKELNIWELPLTVMEVSLFHYQGLSPKEGFQRIRTLVDIVKKYKGVFVLLWHNSSLDDFELPGWRGTYEKVLGYLAGQNVLGATAKETLRVWERGACTLETGSAISRKSPRERSQFP